MPKPVMVQFTPESSWTFIGDPTRVQGKDDIVYHRDPGNAPWRFTGATITPPHPQFAIDVKEQRVTISDACAAGGTFCVVLTVRHDNGQSYPSPDPQIINEPQKSFPSLYVVIGLVVGAIVGALIDANTGPLTSRGMLKGLLVGAVIGAIVGVAIARMLAGRDKP
jgi:uncharacterized membrane protein YeaQ/YmgE (transglycosylase-associated protein family)